MLLAAFERAYPQVDVRLITFDLTQPACGLLDRSSDVALLRPPVAAAGIELRQLDEESRVFVLPAGHPLGSRDTLTLADVAGAALGGRRSGHRRVRPGAVAR